MKLGKIILILALIMPAVTACEGKANEKETTTGTDSTANEKEISVSEVANAVLNDVEFVSPAEKTIDDIQYYMDIDVSTVEEMVYYICGSAVSTDELLIVKFKSKSDAEAAKPIVEARLESQKGIFEDYAPAEMYKLEGAVIKIKDEYLFYFAMSDNDKVLNIINTYI